MHSNELNNRIVAENNNCIL